MTTPNYPTYAEFCIALMAYDVASAQLSHLEDFFSDSGISYMEHKDHYLATTRRCVEAYRTYSAVVDRMYA